MTDAETVVLPPLTGALDVLWELILDLATELPESGWVLGDPDAAEWRRLGDAADDGYATWRLLLG